LKRDCNGASAYLILSTENPQFLMNTLTLFQTYSINYQVSDSAATASAMFSGVKTQGYTLGYDSSIDSQDPASMITAEEVTTVLSWAQEAGKATGMVCEVDD
jgi:alkaline phosphatase